ncbi:MAG TPA: hypothetical protein DCM62_07870 [Bacteroidales bacterium]|nr:hypothetical protein [Bacteroidales bacterium]
MFQVNLFAQDKNEAKTLFRSGNPINTKDLGFFVAPSYGLTQMDGSTASLFSLRGGMNLKDKFSFGAYFNTSLNQIRPQSETIQNIYMDYWTVGGFIEYTLFSKRVAHLTFPLYVGYGEVEMDNENGAVGLGEANFFQIEPSALLEVNLHKYMRFNLGVGYRLVGQMNYRNFKQSDISGLTGYVGLKLGLFR